MRGCSGPDEGRGSALVPAAIGGEQRERELPPWAHAGVARSPSLGGLASRGATEISFVVIRPLFVAAFARGALVRGEDDDEDNAVVEAASFDDVDGEPDALPGANVAAGADAVDDGTAADEATSFSTAISSFGISAITTTDRDATVANASPGPNHGAANHARQPPRVTVARFGTAAASRAIRST